MLLNRPDVILFDLGGVVVRWVGIEALSEMTGFSVAEVKEKFAASDIGNEFERGLTDNQSFIEEFKTLFSLEGSHQELTALWNSWVGAPYAGIVEAIMALRETYRIACLSNTNDLHWKHLNAYLKTEILFSPAYASHQINLAKPDRECFEFVIADLNVAPETILFLDDSQANIDAAEAADIQAHLVDPKHGALPTLNKLGLI